MLLFIEDFCGKLRFIIIWWVEEFCLGMVWSGEYIKLLLKGGWWNGLVMVL